MKAIPGFTAQTAVYRTSLAYRAGARMGAAGTGIIPAIPPCRNCDHICDLCVETGLACGACRLCAIGSCDPCPPGGCEPPEPRPRPFL